MSQAKWQQKNTNPNVYQEVPQVPWREDHCGVKLDDVALVQSKVMVGS